MRKGILYFGVGSRSGSMAQLIEADSIFGSSGITSRLELVRRLRVPQP